MNVFKKPAFFSLCFFLTILWILLSTSPAKADDKIIVVASTSWTGAIAEAAGADEVRDARLAAAEIALGEIVEAVVPLARIEQVAGNHRVERQAGGFRPQGRRFRYAGFTCHHIRPSSKPSLRTQQLLDWA